MLDVYGPACFCVCDLGQHVAIRRSVWVADRAFHNVCVLHISNSLSAFRLALVDKDALVMVKFN